MKVLVSGSRNIDSRDVVFTAIRNSPWNPDTLIHGGADGVDSIANTYPVYTPQEVSVEEHPIPDWAWEKVGRNAGPLRNSYMVSEADAVIAIWDGESNGTKDAINQARGAGLPVYRVLCSNRDGEWVAYSRKLMEDDQSCLEDFE